MDPLLLFQLLGAGPGPALYHPAPDDDNDNDNDDATAAAMVNGANGVNGGSGGASSSSSSSDSDDSQPRPMPGRRCFVTVGATAGFTALLDEVTTTAFLQCLSEHGYDTLDLQCGPDLARASERIANLSDEDKHGVWVRCFDYTTDMAGYVLNCRSEANVRLAGCVIAHGGTGTVGEVLAVGAPLVVVANPTLMDNHQLELAESLEAQNLAVHGRIGNLPASIARIATRVAQGTLDALPPYSPPPFPVPAADRLAFFDWMLLTCYPEALAQQEHLASLDAAAAAGGQQEAQREQPVDTQQGPQGQEGQEGVAVAVAGGGNNRGEGSGGSLQLD